MKLFSPSEGFSTGTKQGLCVAIPLLLLLLGITLFVEVQGRSALSVSLDVLAGTCLAIIGVWVVGGTFELEGKLRDISLKAAGGVAVMLFIAAWVRPYHNAMSYAPDPINIVLPANAPLRFIYDEIIAKNGTTDVPTKIEIKKDADKVLALRPKPIDQDLSYSGSSWLEILERLASQASCLSVSEDDNNTILLGIDISRIEQRNSLVTCRE